MNGDNALDLYSCVHLSKNPTEKNCVCSQAILDGNVRHIPWWLTLKEAIILRTTNRRPMIIIASDALNAKAMEYGHIGPHCKWKHFFTFCKRQGHIIILVGLNLRMNNLTSSCNFRLDTKQNEGPHTTLVLYGKSMK